MSLLFAAEYNVSQSETSNLTGDLSGVLNRMTQDAYDARCSLDYVLEQCRKHLRGRSSEEICNDLVTVAHLDSSMEGEWRGGGGGFRVD